MRKRYFRPTKPEYVTGALFQLRAEIVRGDLDGLDHVEALLRLCGADLDAQHIPKPIPKRFKRRELSREIVNLLKGGPMRACDAANRLREGRDCDKRQFYQAVYIGLVRLRERGVVVCEGKVWRVAP